MPLKLKLGLLSLALTVQIGCKPKSNEDEPSEAPLILPPGVTVPGKSLNLQFTKNPDSAVMASGIVGNPTFIADPGVVKDSSGYHLFITDQFCDLNNNSAWDTDEHLFNADATLLCVASRGVGATMYIASARPLGRCIDGTVRPE